MHLTCLPENIILNLVMKSDPDKLIKKHPQLTHTDMARVVSHVQRDKGDWVLNTLMIDGCEVPFKYKRRKRYKNLRGQRVNLTYYPDSEIVAGMEFETMKVVRVRVA